MELLQHSGHLVGGGGGGEGHIAIQDELGLGVLFAAVDETGAGVDLQPHALFQADVGVQGGLAHQLLIHIGLAQDADIGGADQVVPQQVGEAQGPAGDGVDIAQAVRLKAVG